jgi:hypothetical protein
MELQHAIAMQAAPAMASIFLIATDSLCLSFPNVG